MGKFYLPAFFKGGKVGPYAVHLNLWMEGWKIYKAHPLIGIGRDGYKETMNQKMAANQISPEIAVYSTPHNIYLINLIAYGIIGLFILGSSMIYFSRKPKKEEEN